MNIPKAQSALTPKSDLPWTAKDAYLRLFSYYGLIMVFMMTLQLGFANLLIHINKNANSFIVEAAIDGIVGIVLTLVFLSFDNKKFKSIGLSYHNKLGLLIIVGLVLTIISLSCAYAIEMYGGVVANLSTLLNDRYKIEDLGNISNLLNYSAIVIITFLGIAVGEEIMFRGYIQNLMESQTTFLRATIVSSVLFGFLHSFLDLTSTQYVIQTMVAVGVSATIFGFVFSYAYEISGKNLLLPIIIHGTWDSIIYFFKTQYVYHTLLNVLAEIFSQLIAASVLILLLYLLKKYVFSFESN